MQWVTVLSMDSFYKVLNLEQHELAQANEYNFDTPNAFDFDLMYEALKRLSEGKSVDVPVYDFTTHKRDINTIVMYGADVLIFEGILAFHDPKIVELMDIKVSSYRSEDGKATDFRFLWIRMQTRDLLEDFIGILVREEGI